MTLLVNGFFAGLASSLSEARIICKFEEKDFYLYYFLLVHPGRTLVFCNSIDSVRRLTSVLNLLRVKPLALHSNMIQKQRLKNLERLVLNLKFIEYFFFNIS